MADPPIAARHLLVCREVLFDPFDAEAPYSLRGVVTHLTPDAIGFPLCCEVLWVYIELFGEPGRYVVRVELVALDEDGGDLGPPVVVRDWTPVRVRPEKFVEGVRLQLYQTVFPDPGLYEFRLVLDGFDQPLIVERFKLED
jgi:hypothetical protein